MEQKVTVRAQRGRIVIEPVKRVQYSLEELVSGINAGNLHGEADFGRPVGKEWLKVEGAAPRIPETLSGRN